MAHLLSVILIKHFQFLMELLDRNRGVFLARLVVFFILLVASRVDLVLVDLFFVLRRAFSEAPVVEDLWSDCFNLMVRSAQLSLIQ